MAERPSEEVLREVVSADDDVGVRDEAWVGLAGEVKSSSDQKSESNLSAYMA